MKLPFKAFRTELFFVKILASGRSGAETVSGLVFPNSSTQRETVGGGALLCCVLDDVKCATGGPSNELPYVVVGLSLLAAPDAGAFLAAHEVCLSRVFSFLRPDAYLEPARYAPTPRYNAPRPTPIISAVLVKPSRSGRAPRFFSDLKCTPKPSANMAVASKNCCTKLAASSTGAGTKSSVATIIIAIKPTTKSGNNGGRF